jgi:hypothetical protein
MENRDPLPDGEYRVIAIESEMKETAKKNGSYLQITWEVLDAEYKGRKMWSRLNLENENTQTVEIAQRELSSICRAVGVLRPKDSTELHDKPITVRVSTEAGTGGYGPQNRIKAYKPIDGATPAAGPTAPPAATPTASGGAKRPPWRT